MIETAKTGFASGMTYTDIANALGNVVSRSAVGGLLSREGLKRSPELREQLCAQRIKRSPKPEKAARVDRPRVPPPKPTREAGDAYEPMVQIRKAAWIALEGSTPQAEIPSPGHCKWPIGTWDEGDRFYCCNTVRARDDGKPAPYCAGHYDMGYDLTDTRAKRARALKGALWAARAA